MTNIQALTPIPVLAGKHARAMRCTAAIADISASLLGAEVGELTRWEMLVMAPEQAVLDRFLPQEIITQLFDTRTDVRILYGLAERSLPSHCAALAGDAEMLVSTGGLSHFLVIRDRSVVYLPAQEAGYPMASRVIRLRSNTIAELLAIHFEAMWTQAKQSRRDDAAEGRHDEILNVLSEGLTDDRAAMRLHMSKRTFARRVAALMDHLDARSRFQAGMKAAHRGLV